MALPTKGVISIQSILTEMGYSKRTISLDELGKLWYYRTGKSKFNVKTRKLSDWYGESWNTYGYYNSYSRGTTNFNSIIGEL